ncbi:GTP binding protein (Bud4) [Ophiocordyceps camponoti-floridani]|uniref:GTP binding protein (Bud4) n=1 Tax=Ophiocordyceps camponoti-floridani TaxID=2030778 RepID=A0A8H4Q4T8_9HYPO|nr:GTP binding protein (Bud4) [Ophiocordyceps camponoti-floridani]
MASEPVHPLRIAKQATPNSSPSRMSSGLPRPLSEISPTEKRRNSPSWRQYTPTKTATPGNDSSPFQSSPLEAASSPRLFWQNRNSENMLQAGGPGASPTRRSSIERLQRASRVRNSNILALEQKQEYDPARLPRIQRPLARVQGDGLASPLSSAGLRSSDSEQKAIDGKSTIGPNKSPLALSPSPNIIPRPPSRNQTSPTKSSLSPSKLNKDSETGVWSGQSSLDERELPDGRFLHRHPKSVTFDAAPPQVNEYEMATPDLSSIGTNSREGSFESADDEDEGEDEALYDPARGAGQDDSFDESLEDTAKTPVVGPDDWRGESPVVSAGQRRNDSVASNSDQRPLPPLPGPGGHARSHSASSIPSSPALCATAERMLGGGLHHRSLPVPPPASATKSDIQSFGHGRMTLEERLKLMMLSDDASPKSAAEQQRERRLRRGAASRDRGDTPQSEHESVVEGEAGADVARDSPILDDYHLPPRISRESIMRRFNGNMALEDDPFCSPAATKDEDVEQGRLMLGNLDPDVPIPSTEDPVLHEACSTAENDTWTGDADGQPKPVEADDNEAAADDGESHYSDEEEQPDDHDMDVGLQTPRAGSPALELKLGNDVPDLGPAVLSAAKAEAAAEVEEERSTSADAPVPMAIERPRTPEARTSKPEYDGSGWGDPGEEFDDDRGTPDSVIRHPRSDQDDQDSETHESPVIPERVATIKSASGSKLKTRVSNTPSDLAAMREARRQVSQEVPQVPPIPERHRKAVAPDLEVPDEQAERRASFKNRSLTLDIDMGLSLDQDFERVIEAQKRGYLMRQNTKLVSASDKDGDVTWKSRSANNSPIKQDRPASWVIEPWHGSESQSKSARKRPGTSAGPVPPLPGQESNATAHRQVSTSDTQSEAATIDTVERGRLFVKVMGVKDLDLPLPKNERTWFSLTLDNGVHCVTTAWLELARNAPIGQEFELVVPNDLEFQLTLNVKLEKPVHSELPAMAAKTAKPKTSTLSRVFASPRKRRELEMRQKAEEERFAAQQKEAVARRNRAPSGYELLSPLAADDGSFGRAYVCLKEHEGRCFGRPCTADVMLFNEWATEEESFASSVKSKRGTSTVVRRAPYKIGKLELQLLFVPRPKTASDDDMPKSMNSCVRELRAAEERLARSWEGHLSQQGGDCPYWRRRYFKLAGSKLTAYHESTRQPRATINLCNAKRLIDDRRSLTERDTAGKHGKRRRSAFAEEEEGYMFVEEGFRIRFNNGEVIDFYADTAADKEAWMRVLSEVVGRGESDEVVGEGVRSRAKWCELVLRREEQLRRRRSHTRAKSSVS